MTATVTHSGTPLSGNTAIDATMTGTRTSTQGGNAPTASVTLSGATPNDTLTFNNLEPDTYTFRATAPNGIDLVDGNPTSTIMVVAPILSVSNVNSPNLGIPIAISLRLTKAPVRDVAVKVSVMDGGSAIDSTTVNFTASGPNLTPTVMFSTGSSTNIPSANDYTVAFSIETAAHQPLITLPSGAPTTVTVRPLPTVTVGTPALTSPDSYNLTATVMHSGASLPPGDTIIQATMTGLRAGNAPTASVTLSGATPNDTLTFNNLEPDTYTFRATAPSGIDLGGGSPTPTITVEAPVLSVSPTSMTTPAIGANAVIDLSLDKAPVRDVTVTVGVMTISLASPPSVAFSTADTYPATQQATITTGSGMDIAIDGTYTVAFSIETAADQPLITLPSGAPTTVTVSTPTLSVAFLSTVTENPAGSGNHIIAIGDTGGSRTSITIEADRAPSADVAIQVTATLDIPGSIGKVAGTAMLTSSTSTDNVLLSSGIASSDLPTAGDYTLSFAVTGGMGLVNLPVGTTASIQVLPVPAPDEPTAVDLGGDPTAISSVEFIDGYEMMVGVSDSGFLDTDVITLRVGVNSLDQITPTSLTFAQLRSGTRFIVQGENTQLTQAATHNIVARTTRNLISN